MLKVASQARLIWQIGYIKMKIKAQDLFKGDINEETIQELENNLRSSGLGDDQIKEITEILQDAYTTTEESGTTEPTFPEGPESPMIPGAPKPPTDEGVKNILQPGKGLRPVGSDLIISAKELLRRISTASRLQLCAEDLSKLELEIENMTGALMVLENWGFDEAYELAEDSIYGNFSGDKKGE